MATLVEIHPVNPQQRLIHKVVDVLNAGGLIAYPTDSGYALGCTMGEKDALDRMRKIRQLPVDHDFTLVLSSFKQLGQYVIVDNPSFRAINRATPGPYTFILKGTKEVPRLMLNPKKHTVGARIPEHTVAQDIVATLGAPLVSTTLILPGEETPLSEGWVVDEKLGKHIDLIVDAPVTSIEPTTVIDLSGEVEDLVRRAGAGDTTPFE